MISVRGLMKYFKLTGIFFVLAAVCWAVVIFGNPADLGALLSLTAIALSIAFVCFFVIIVVKVLWKNTSPYRIFAVTDSLIGAGVLIYSIHDIMTSTGMFAGFLGALLIIFIMPIVIGLLIADLVVWVVNKRKIKSAEIVAREDDVSNNGED